MNNSYGQELGGRDTNDDLETMIIVGRRVLQLNIVLDTTPLFVFYQNNKHTWGEGLLVV